MSCMSNIIIHGESEKQTAKNTKASRAHFICPKTDLLKGIILKRLRSCIRGGICFQLRQIAIVTPGRTRTLRNML